MTPGVTAMIACANDARAAVGGSSLMEPAGAVGASGEAKDALGSCGPRCMGHSQAAAPTWRVPQMGQLTRAADAAPAAMAKGVASIASTSRME